MSIIWLPCITIENCDQKCNRPVQSRLRFLGSDVGFYLKWDEDELGYPTMESCGAFSGKVTHKKGEEKLNRDEIESKLCVPEIQESNENALIKSYEISSHLICL